MRWSFQLSTINAKMCRRRTTCRLDLLKKMKSIFFNQPVFCLPMYTCMLHWYSGRALVLHESLWFESCFNGHSINQSINQCWRNRNKQVIQMSWAQFLTNTIKISLPVTSLSAINVSTKTVVDKIKILRWHSSQHRLCHFHRFAGWNDFCKVC